MRRHRVGHGVCARARGLGECEVVAMSSSRLVSTSISHDLVQIALLLIRHGSETVITDHGCLVDVSIYTGKFSKAPTAGNASAKNLAVSSSLICRAMLRCSSRKSLLPVARGPGHTPCRRMISLVQQGSGHWYY